MCVYVYLCVASLLRVFKRYLSAFKTGFFKVFFQVEHKPQMVLMEVLLHPIPYSVSRSLLSFSQTSPVNKDKQIE